MTANTPPADVYVMALCPGATRTALLAAAGTAFDDLPNKSMAFSSRLLSRRAAVRMIGSFAPKETLGLSGPAKAPLAIAGGK